MPSREKNITGTIGKRIRKLRNESNFTQKELADRLFKSESTVRMWELGKSEPDIETINKLSGIFDVSADYLMNGTTTESHKTDISDLQVALFGGDEEVTDEMWDEVVNFANYVKAKHKGKQDKK